MQRSTITRTRSGSASSAFAVDEDVHAKNHRACAGETSAAAASRIIAHWAARRRQACEHMVLSTLDLDRRDRESELLALARLHAVSMLDASFLRAADDDVGRWRARSPERAFVRRIAREWTASPRGAGEGASSRHRAEEWMGETERQRVRSVRERVRMASQGYAEDHRPNATDDAPRHRGRQARADVVRRMAMERQRELQGLSEQRAVSAFAHRGRIQSFLRGRFSGSGRPMNDERPISVTARELGQLRQNHPVSRLREELRFRTEGIAIDQIAENSSENNVHGTHHVISEHNHGIVENATHGSEIQTHRPMEHEGARIETTVTDGNDIDFDQRQIQQYEGYSDSGSSEQDSEHSGSVPSAASGNSMQQESEIYRQPDFLETDEEWHVIDSQEIEPQWQSDQNLSSSNRNINSNRFSPPDGDVYGVELRELLSRRSVSNLLSSGFRESLDQLVQSYVQRQEVHDPDPDPDDWGFEGQRSTDGLHNDDDLGEHSRMNGEDEAEHDAPVLHQHSDSAVLPPGETILQEQRRWQQMELPHANWSLQTFDWDAIHVLRDELTGVQRGMTSMQQMLEACMEMQIELQRSIKQEVSAALNRPSSAAREEEEMLKEEEDVSQWKLARKGTCCICCDNQIDSLLYRCGHMCTCSKCASELLHGVGKCPLCRAPIVEVIRAYSIT